MRNASSTDMNIDEIMRRIKEEVKRRQEHPEQEVYQEAGELIPKSSAPEDNAIKKFLDNFLWKYGRRFKKIVKRVPILRDIARKQHSRLAHQFIYSHPISQQSLQSPLGINVLPYYINYHGFLVQVRKEEGLKGKLKSFLFKFIRFFAWWQEQINRALYHELMTQKAKMDERERWVQELSNQQINRLTEELSKRDKVAEDLNSKLVLLDQAKDELSRELGDQRVKIGKTESHLEELLSQQNDRLRVALAERDKVVEDLGNRLNLFGQAKDELSRELGDQRVKIGKTESHLEELLSQQNDRLRVALAERDKVVEDLGNRVSLFEQTKDELSRDLGDQKRKIDETEKWVQSLLGQQMDGIIAKLAERDEVVEGLNSRLVQFSRVEDELNRELTVQKDILAAIEKETKHLLSQEMDNLKLEFTEAYKNLNDMLESTKKELSGLLEVKSAVNRMAEEMRNHKLKLLDQQRRLALLFEEAKKRLPKPIGAKQIKNIISEEDHLLDAMYVDFEEKFRGSMADIKERLKVYLPYLKQANIGARKSVILDLGCGRGEWLEILKKEGYVAKGVEINRVMLDVCRERSLDVVEGGAIEYLRSQKANSLGAVTAFHLVEHLSLKDLISLFDESLRILKPKGLIIFETPNPENLIVGAYTFHFDPTHRCLLVPESLNFIAQQRGFVDTNILRLHKYSDFNPIDEVADGFKNKWFYSETDFALIGYKP